jgi:hypothetical protein
MDLANNPAAASKMECYRCGQRIADAEYLLNEDGLPRHFCCPPQPICAECREPIENMRRVVRANDGALFHGRCWRNV